eukprot:9797270-Alexandrium_andersonii.AAC.1
MRENFSGCVSATKNVEEMLPSVFMDGFFARGGVGIDCELAACERVCFRFSIFRAFFLIFFRVSD